MHTASIVCYNSSTIYNSFACHSGQRDCIWFHLTLSMIYYSTASQAGIDTTKCAFPRWINSICPNRLNIQFYFQSAALNMPTEIRITEGNKRGISLIKRRVSYYKHNSECGTGNVNIHTTNFLPYRMVLTLHITCQNMNKKKKREFRDFPMKSNDFTLKSMFSQIWNQNK